MSKQYESPGFERYGSLEEVTEQGASSNSHGHGHNGHH
jgi:hypothetical protein